MPNPAPSSEKRETQEEQKARVEREKRMEAAPIYRMAQTEDGKAFMKWLERHYSPERLRYPQNLPFCHTRAALIDGQSQVVRDIRAAIRLHETVEE